ncbi:MAG TPA: N-acetylmuramic acid 6-phosphate etherase [Gemmatimonadales bacterium]|jgi:N-acetylmuramic acid 6-phosphate etherase|nr:N-acetylmuramic acid 6-phosphate etherase [Gemmatimonadales bacterium]
MARQRSASPPGDGPDLRLTERRNPRTADLDLATALEIADLINSEDATVSAAVAAARESIAKAIDLIERGFRAGGRLIYVGAGTSGRLGVLDAAECPPTFGTPPEMVIGLIAGGYKALVRSVEGAEDDINAAIEEINGQKVTSRDVVVGIAASGTTPWVRAALGRAQGVGATTIFLSCSEPPALLRETCDVCITVLVGPEVLTGSTRMKAGTATKLVLNMLTTGAMVRLGKAYGNLMVDLQAWNEKLNDRSERILIETAGVDRAGARAALNAAGGQVKTAIVMLRRKVGRTEAERLLSEHQGHLRPIVGDPPPVPAP